MPIPDLKLNQSQTTALNQTFTSGDLVISAPPARLAPTTGFTLNWGVALSVVSVLLVIWQMLRGRK